MLIGRESEQQAIDRLVSGARIGSSGVLAITGEAGVGKTALLRWAEGRLDGFRVLRATGTEPEHEVPFGGLLTVLRPALGLLDEIPAPQARALSAALALSAGPRRGPVRDRCGDPEPALPVRRGARPSRSSSTTSSCWTGLGQEALTFAARRLGADPVAVLMTAREGESEEVLEGLERLRLAGLDLDATRSLVGGMAIPTLTGDWVARVHELTGGNPLAITELASDPAGAGADVPGPAATRVGGAGRVVRTAAVLPRPAGAGRAAGRRRVQRRPQAHHGGVRRAGPGSGCVGGSP